MKVKKMFKKASIGYGFIREYGLLSFGIKSLTYLQKRQFNKRNRISEKYKLAFKAKHQDIIHANDFNVQPKQKVNNKKTLNINWIMPPPGKGSGGHHNIFRFIQYLENAGHKNNIYLYTEGINAPIDLILDSMGDSYPQVSAKMEWLDNNNSMVDSDILFCTSWETAYASKNAKTSARRFYFVQDYEPFFYPVGSLYSLARNTYNFGFFGITAGGWLSKKLSTEHNMRTAYYDFGADSQTYGLTNNNNRKEIFFYARPFTERRGFEMGILALEIFHNKHPEIIINFAGWDVSDYEIPFPYKNLKTLEISELKDLYNRCAAGLLLSYTNMSLLPLELLACGTIPVVNDGENNRLVSNNPYIAYADDNPHALAEKLSEIITMKNPTQFAQKASTSVELASWDESGKKFLEIIEKEVKNG